jgi:hypothetical protein
MIAASSFSGLVDPSRDGHIRIKSVGNAASLCHRVLNPNTTAGRREPPVAWPSFFGGVSGEAIPPLERGLTLNPYDPQNFVWYNLLALAHLFAGRADEAIAAAVKARKVRPAWRPIYKTLACSYAMAGWLQEAGACVEQMRQLEEPSGAMRWDRSGCAIRIGRPNSRAC